jgi:exosome complex exonuclease DIS3/RRP44
MRCTRSIAPQLLRLTRKTQCNPVSNSVLDCLPTLPWQITDEDRAERTDLRSYPICSIDPPGCTDIDDALHVRPLPNGNFEVGVRILSHHHHHCVC